MFKFGQNWRFVEVFIKTYKFFSCFYKETGMADTELCSTKTNRTKKLLTIKKTYDYEKEFIFVDGDDFRNNSFLLLW